MAKPAWDEFRIAVKRRFYVRCQHLFPGAAKKLSTASEIGLGGTSYIWNEVLEDDQFAQKIGNAEGGQADEQALSMLGGMAGKIQLNSMFEELIKMYDAIKSKIAVMN